MTDAILKQRTAAVRSFNRFYTKQIGLLHEHLLKSAFSLTEVRVLYELAHRHGPTSTELIQVLGLDAGYLSRLLRSFEKRGLISRETSRLDGRQSHLSLTRKGRDSFAPLDGASNKEVEAMLADLSQAEQERLTGAMQSIEILLGDRSTPDTAYALRTHRPGDMGWVVQRHGELYWQEYRWDERFEGLVAGITAKFIESYDATRERCWIAEKSGSRIGCVFLVKDTQEIARLRLLLVEPSARGLGLGKRLVEECTRFARKAGYRKISLWTNSVLDAARHIYAQQGYRIVHEEKHTSFGHKLVGETWELSL